MTELEVQIKNILEEKNDWQISRDQESYVLVGKYVLNSEYKGVPLYDEYYLEIIISKLFPAVIPTVKVISGEIPKDYEHIYKDRSLCMGTTIDLYDFLYDTKSVKAFIDQIVDSCLYSMSYYKRYKTVPFGERSHNIEGDIESFLDRYKLKEEQFVVLCKILYILGGWKKYRGHEECPCGSGKRLRNCHGKYIMEDINSEYYPHIKELAGRILRYTYLRIKEERANEKSGT